MHEYRQLIEEQMSAFDRYQGWGAQSRLAEDAGIDRQLISRTLKDDRDVLGGAPSEKTVKGLAKAFGIEPDVIWVAVARALGLPSHVVPSITHEVGTVSDEVLLGELAKRFGLAATFRQAQSSAPEDEKTSDIADALAYPVLNPLHGSDESEPETEQAGPADGTAS